MKKIITIAAAALLCISAFAQGKEYLASYFGIKSNGEIDNTTSIQKAIDFIAEKGGGTLTFSVGRYLTGAVYLKSGVNIRLDAAADIIGTDSIYGYKGQKAIFNGIGVENITIYTTRGNGVIDGRGDLVIKSFEDQKKKGFVTEETPVPTLLYFKDCKNIKLKKVLYRNPAVKGQWYIAENSAVTVDGCFTDTRD
jgi:polygalacturonase